MPFALFLGNNACIITQNKTTITRNNIRISSTLSFLIALVMLVIIMSYPKRWLWLLIYRFYIAIFIIIFNILFVLIIVIMAFHSIFVFVIMFSPTDGPCFTNFLFISSLFLVEVLLLVHHHKKLTSLKSYHNRSSNDIFFIISAFRDNKRFSS